MSVERYSLWPSGSYERLSDTQTHLVVVVLGLEDVVYDGQTFKFPNESARGCAISDLRSIPCLATSHSIDSLARSLTA